MIRFAALAALAAGTLLFATTRDASSQSIILPGVSGNQLNEPVLVYSITGGTLTGGIHMQLTVYNSGFATIARYNDTVFPTPGIYKDVETAGVGLGGAARLANSLKASGAFNLQDQGLIVSDVPLTTVTVFDGATDADAHTYSYWIGAGDYALASTVIQKFIQKHFPGF